MHNYVCFSVYMNFVSFFFASFILFVFDLSYFIIISYMTICFSRETQRMCIQWEVKSRGAGIRKGNYMEFFFYFSRQILVYLYFSLIVWFYIFILTIEPPIHLYYLLWSRWPWSELQLLLHNAKFLKNETKFVFWKLVNILTSTFYIPPWCASSLFKDSITLKTSRNIKSDTAAREADMLTVHLHLSLGISKSHPPVSYQLWNRTPATAPSSPMHHFQWITQIFSSKFIAFFISSHRKLTTHYFVPASINTPPPRHSLERNEPVCQENQVG